MEKLLNKKIFIYAMLCFSIVFSANAFSQEFKIPSSSKTDSIVGKVPYGWKFNKDMFGLPFVLMSKKHNSGHRSIISITPTKIKDHEIDKTTLSKKQSDYQRGRQEYIDNYGGEIVKFFKFKKNSINKLKSFSIGYQYEVSDKYFEEKTYFVTCGDEVFHVKYLMNLLDEEFDKAIIEQTIRSLECKRGQS